MWTAILGPVLDIVKEGLIGWNEERRTRFMDEHREILEALRFVENAVGDDYNDDELGLIKENYIDFLLAYKNELKEHNKEQRRLL